MLKRPKQFPTAASLWPLKVGFLSPFQTLKLVTIQPGAAQRVGKSSRGKLGQPSRGSRSQTQL